MISAFVKAVGQLPDPPFRRVLAIGLGLSVLVFACVWTATGWGLAHLALFESGWLNAATEFLGGAAMVVLSWILFPPVATMTVGLFLDGVVEAVENRYYPGMVPARRQSLGETLKTTAKLSGATLILNLLALPVYLFVPVLNVFVFFGLNGYLLGREYFELVALRRMEPSAARAMWHANRGRLLVGGAMIALPFALPLVNLAMPLVAAAFMVHLVTDLTRRQGSATSALS